MALEEFNISVMQWTLIEGVQCPTALLFYYAKSTGGLSSSHKHMGPDTLAHPWMRTAAETTAQHSSTCFSASMDIEYFKNGVLLKKMLLFEHKSSACSSRCSCHKYVQIPRVYA